MVLERTADYLRWVAPSLVVLIGYPIALILACWLTAVIVRRFLTRRYEVQDRQELQATIHDLNAVIAEKNRAVEIRITQGNALRARIRENHALVSKLAQNYAIVDAREDV